MTPDELRALAPELFAIAEQQREEGGDVRIRCIRVGVDEDGRGGEVVAGKMPERDPREWSPSPEGVAALLEHNRIFKVHQQRPYREFGYGKK